MVRVLFKMHKVTVFFKQLKGQFKATNANKFSYLYDTLKTKYFLQEFEFLPFTGISAITCTKLFLDVDIALI